MAETKFSKDTDYNCDSADFVLDNEITVTITLHEYRKLVTEAATASTRIKEAEADKYTRNRENEELKKEIAELKEKLVNSIGKVTIQYENVGSEV